MEGGKERVNGMGREDRAGKGQKSGEEKGRGKQREKTKRCWGGESEKNGNMMGRKLKGTWKQRK